MGAQARERVILHGAIRNDDSVSATKSMTGMF